MKQLFFGVVCLFIFTGTSIFCQNVAINTTGAVANTSAMLDVSSTNTGILIPRLALTATNSNAPVGASVTTSLLVYNTATSGAGTTAVSPGFYFWDGAQWVRFETGNLPGPDWTVIGNTGTNPAIHFLGTTDAVDFVIRTNNVEKMRITSGGLAGINMIPTMRLDVTDASTTAGNATIRGTATGAANTFGVLGISSSATGQGVFGFNSNGSGTGVIGSGNGLVGNYMAGGGGGAFTSSNVAVYGFGNNTALSWGVYGQSANGTGTGVEGFNSAAGATAGFGVFGQSAATGGSGVAGYLGAGATTFFAGSGVSGITINTVTNGLGVIGMCNNNTGTGIWGQSTGANATGVFGSVSGVTAFGTWGVNSNVSGTGTVGAGNGVASSYLIAGSGGAFTGQTVGLYGQSNQAGITQNAGVFGYCASFARGSYLSLYNGTYYKTIATGAATNSCSVPDMNGNMVCMHAPETPEAYFQDFGQGQLVNGVTHIDLDPIFAKNVTINDKHPLRVFIQLEDNENCKGVVVKNKTATGFDVVELGGGTSNTPFQYTVTCNMADSEGPNGLKSKFADLRFEPAPVVEQSNQKETITTRSQEQSVDNQKTVISITK